MSRPKKFNDYSYGVGLEYNASSYKQVKDAMKGDMDALLKLAKSYNEAIKIDPNVDMSKMISALKELARIIDQTEKSGNPFSEFVDKGILSRVAALEQNIEALTTSSSELKQTVDHMFDGIKSVGREKFSGSFDDIFGYKSKEIDEIAESIKKLSNEINKLKTIPSPTVGTFNRSTKEQKNSSASVKELDSWVEEYKKLADEVDDIDPSDFEKIGPALKRMRELGMSIKEALELPNIQKSKNFSEYQSFLKDAAKYFEKSVDDFNANMQEKLGDLRQQRKALEDELLKTKESVTKLGGQADAKTSGKSSNKRSSNLGTLDQVVDVSVKPKVDTGVWTETINKKLKAVQDKLDPIVLKATFSNKSKSLEKELDGNIAAINHTVKAEFNIEDNFGDESDPNSFFGKLRKLDTDLQEAKEKLSSKTQFKVRFAFESADGSVVTNVKSYVQNQFKNIPVTLHVKNGKSFMNSISNMISGVKGNFEKSLTDVPVTFKIKNEEELLQSVNTLKESIGSSMENINVGLVTNGIINVGEAADEATQEVEELAASVERLNNNSSKKTKPLDTLLKEYDELSEKINSVYGNKKKFIATYGDGDKGFEAYSKDIARLEQLEKKLGSALEERSKAKELDQLSDSAVTAQKNIIKAKEALADLNKNKFNSKFFIEIGFVQNGKSIGDPSDSLAKLVEEYSILSKKMSQESFTPGSVYSNSKSGRSQYNKDAERLTFIYKTLNDTLQNQIQLLSRKESINREILETTSEELSLREKQKGSKSDLAQGAAKAEQRYAKLNETIKKTETILSDLSSKKSLLTNSDKTYQFIKLGEWDESVKKFKRNREEMKKLLEEYRNLHKANKDANITDKNDPSLQREYELRQKINNIIKEQKKHLMESLKEQQKQRDLALKTIEAYKKAPTSESLSSKKTITSTDTSVTSAKKSSKEIKALQKTIKEQEAIIADLSKKGRSSEYFTKLGTVDKSTKQFQKNTAEVTKMLARYKELAAMDKRTKAQDAEKNKLNGQLTQILIAQKKQATEILEKNKQDLAVLQQKQGTTEKTTKKSVTTKKATNKGVSSATTTTTTVLSGDKLGQLVEITSKILAAMTSSKSTVKTNSTTKNTPDKTDVSTTNKQSNKKVLSLSQRLGKVTAQRDALPEDSKERAAIEERIKLIKREIAEKLKSGKVDKTLMMSAFKLGQEEQKISIEISQGRKEDTASIKGVVDKTKELISLYKQLGKVEANIEYMDEADYRKSAFERERDRLLLEIDRRKQARPITADEDKAYKTAKEITNIELEKRLGASFNAEASAERKKAAKEEADAANKTLEIYKKIGALEAERDTLSEGSKKRVAIQENIDYLKEQASQTQGQINIEQKLIDTYIEEGRVEKQLSMSTKDGAKKDTEASREREKAIRDLIKSSEELGRLNSEINDTTGAKKLEELNKYRESLRASIQEQQESLGVDKKLLEARRRAAYDEETRRRKLKRAEEYDSREIYGTSTVKSAKKSLDDVSGKVLSDEFKNSQKIQEALTAVNNSYDRLVEKQQQFKDSDPAPEEVKEFKYLEDQYNINLEKLNKIIDSSRKLAGQAREGKVYNVTEDLSDIDKLKQQLIEAATRFDGTGIKVENFDEKLKQLDYRVKQQDGTWKNFSVRLTDAGTQIVGLTGKVKNTEGIFKTLFSGSIEKFKNAIQVFSGYNLFFEGISKIRQGIQYVKDIDSALTELKKVTDETDESYAKFLQTMSKTGSEIGATVSNLTNMAASWARLGYSMQEAGNLAKSTAVLLNVSEFTDAEKASEALISTIQAYGYAAEDSMHVVDVLNEIGNNFAISSDGIATALQDSASSLMAAGNNLEQSVAMVAAANKVLQDPNSVGSALRTISLRIRGTSVKVLEEMGEETDGVIESVSKLQAKIKGLTGVNILNDAGGYKDTYTIIKEIAEVWPELDDMNKAATLELLAGKNRSNAMAAMLTNIEDLTAAYEDAMEAEGSAIAENEKYLDSIQGRIDQFTNAVQTMWNNAIGSNVVKMVVSLGTELIKLVDTLGLIPSALAAIAAVKFVKNVSIPAVKESITAVKQVFDEARGVVSTLSSFSGEGLVGFLNGKVESASIDNVIKSIGAEIIARKELNKELAKDILLKNGVKEEDLEGALAAMGYSGANGVLSLSFKELALSIKRAALAFIKSPFGIAVAAVAGIALIVGAVDLLTESFDEAKDKLDEAKEEIETNEQELKSLNSELEETKERIDELNSKDKLTVVEEEELKKLKEQNAQLKTQIGILEERDKYLKSEAAEKARNLYSKDKRVQGSNQSNMPTYAAGAGATGSLVGSTFVTDPNIPQVAAVSGTSTTGENYIKSQLMLQVDNYKKAQKKYQEAIDAANKDSNDQNMKNMETARKNLEDAGSKLNETMQGVANDYADIEWNDSTKEFLKPIYDQLDQARIAVDTSGEAILTAFNRIASQSDFGNEVKSIEETAGLTGEALQEMLSFNDDGTLDTAAGSMNLFVQSLIDCGVISDTSAESLQKVVDLTLMTSENTSDAAVANQKLARSQKMLQYYKLYKELNQYSKQLKNVGNNNKELSDQYKEQISLIRQKMSALAQEISQYDILGEQINEAKSSFEEFENAQTTDEDNTYVDKTSEMFKTLIDGFQTTNVGSEAFKSAFKSLIPKEVYDAPDTLVEKYDAAAKYISETLSKYFKIEYDDDGIIESVEVTSANINKFAEDARDKGLIELSDDGVWTVLETDFKKFAEQMGITEEMLVAIGTQMDKMDADWIMGDTTSFFDSFDMDAQTNIYRAVKNLALLEAQMEDGMVKTEEEKEAWAKSYAEYTKIISDNSKDAVASIEEYNAATAKVDEASAKVDEAKAKLEALKNSGASETEIKIAEGELTTLVEDLTSALAKKNELTAPDEMLITIAQDYLTGQLDTLQTQLLTREWFITPTIKDDGTIESDLFELGEDGKYKIKSGVEIPDEDKALVEQYIEVLNGIKTVSVFFKDENDAQGKADKLQTTAENIDEVLNSLKAQIDVSDAISALEELKTEIDSLKNIKVNVTTEKKTGFWDWLTGGSNHVNTTPQRNTSNGRQNIKLQGTANATGDWGLSQDERNSLVGELGQELVVDPKTGKYYTVGDNGAEFVDLPKDAIIFNHKQTAEIFKNGHINTRGQAYAEGNAHVGTSGTFLTKYGLAAAYGGSVPNYQGYSDVLQHLDTISDTVDDASSDSKDDFEELFDWFEVLVNELDQSIDLITAKIDNTVGASGKNALYQQVIDLNYAKMAALNKGIELYSSKAQEFLNKIPQKYKEMAQNGAVALTDFQGEANEEVVEAIKNYREWKNKAADLNVELENIKKNISDINVQMLEAISTEYENKIGLITNLNDRIQKAMDLQEESGERLSANYYNEMIKNAQEALKLQGQQRKEMQAQLDQSVANGDVERYSEDWYNMVNAINDVDEAIVQSEIDIESFQNAINDLHWENFERLIKSIENVSDEAEHLHNLIKDDDLTDDVGNWTEAGITALGLASQEMENAKYRAELYGKEIEQLKKDYKAGLYSQDEYNDKLQELKSSQWDCIDAYESAKDTIVDLNKTRIEAVKDGIQKEIDAYEELIDKRKEDLDAQKDQHDWAKSVKENTDEIQKIQRQIDALNGDTSASAAAQRKKLQEELANAQDELNEAYYDREIEMQQKGLDESLELYKEDKEKKMEELDEYLEHEEQVLADSYELVLANSEAVYTQLNEMAKEYNIEILNSVVDPWNQGTTALGTYGESLELATSGYVAQLKLIEDELNNIQNQADATARSLIAMANAQSSQIINSGTSSKPSSSGKTSTPASKPSSTTSGKPSVGQTVTVKTSATNWSRDGGNGTRIASFVKGNSYTVKQVSGNEVLIGTSSGYTGWINKKDLIGYAKGTTGVKKNGHAVIDENGLEEIVMHTKGGKVAYLTKGTSVLPHDISENLMKLGSVDYRALLDRNKPKVGAPYVVNNDIELNLNVGEVIHVEHMDNDSLPEIQDAIQKQLDSYIKRMNNGVRKYAR